MKKLYAVCFTSGKGYATNRAEALLTRTELTKKKLIEIAQKELKEEEVKTLFEVVKMKDILDELKDYGEFRIEVEIVCDYALQPPDEPASDEPARIMRVVYSDGYYRYVKKQHKTGLEVEIIPALVRLEIYELDDTQTT